MHHRWTRANGWRMFARFASPAAPPPLDRLPRPVVLVHGLLVSSRYMVPTARHLAALGFPVYAPDLPGYGHSDKPRRALDVPGLADALGAWIDASGLDQPDLVANSFGCQIAADLAARRPACARRLVLLGPTVDPRSRPGAWLAARWLLNLPREPLSLDLVVLRDLLDMGVPRTVQTFAHMMADHLEDKLPAVVAPTLVVRGQHDTTVSPAWVAEAVRLLPRGRAATIPGAGHTVNYNAPRAVARLVRAFLASADPTPARPLVT